MLMPNTVSKKQYFISVAIIVLTGVGLYGLLPQMAHFGTTLTSLKQATPLLVLAGFAAALTGYLLAALLYQLLSYKKLSFRDTFIVQLAGLLINRILPGGIGGLGLNFLYLRAHRHTALQATTVVTLNNLLGVIGHATILVVLIAIRPATVQLIPRPHIASSSLLVTILAAGIGIAVLITVGRHHGGRKLARGIRAQLALFSKYYFTRPKKLLTALLVSGALTLSNAMSLWLSCQAVGITISFFVVFLLFTFGVAVATATPTPGGLGGAEAALVAGLVTQHVSPALALAAALLYRLMTFWLGLLIGLIATARMQSRQLLKQ